MTDVEEHDVYNWTFKLGLDDENQWIIMAGEDGVVHIVAVESSYSMAVRWCAMLIGSARLRTSRIAQPV